MLENVEYSQFENEPREWKFEKCTFERINLIVGKNATGKTRTINILRGLAELLSSANTLPWSEGDYCVKLNFDGQAYSYALKYHERKVVFEELKIDGDLRLTRDESGVGKLFAAKVGEQGDFIQFKTDIDKIACSVKKDSIQHPYLDKLNEWARGVIRYRFNTLLGKGDVFLAQNDEYKLDADMKISIKDTEKVIGIFLQGQGEYPDKFNQAIVDDMRYLDYDIQDVGIDVFEGVTIRPPLPLSGVPSGLFVKEADLPINTRQNDMSDGMFRALSVLIQVNYALLSGQATCILIDDIGEGLDYSRSSALVKLIVEKAEGSNIQLIMATNDRFIMNAVPLEYWLVLIRDGGHVSNLNYRNSKDLFDEFQSIGLNNFDFFSSGYYKRG